MTIPPDAEEPQNQPLIVFLTGSGNNHMQETDSIKKCPQHMYCRKPGNRWAFQNYVIVSIAWEKKNKRKGFNTGPPKCIAKLFAELEERFTNVHKRFVMGFSRGGMGAFDCQMLAPNFSTLHILIAAYYPSCDNYYDRHAVKDIAQSYADHRVDIWFIYGEDDAWIGDVESLRDKFCENSFLRDELFDDIMLPKLDHDAALVYLACNPGHLWIWLEQRLRTIDCAFFPDLAKRRVYNGRLPYNRHVENAEEDIISQKSIDSLRT